MTNLVRNEGIGDGNIKQKVVNIFVDLPALHSDMVVPPELVTPVHSSHTIVVSLYSFRADQRHSYPILLSSQNSLTVVGSQQLYMAITILESIHAVADTLSDCTDRDSPLYIYIMYTHLVITT